MATENMHITGSFFAEDLKKLVAEARAIAATGSREPQVIADWDADDAERLVLSIKYLLERHHRLADLEK